MSTARATLAKMRSLRAVAATLLLACQTPTVTSSKPGASADGGAPSHDASEFTFQPKDGGGGGGGFGGPVPDEHTCSEQVHAAQPVPVDLLLLVDASSSMLEQVGRGPTKHALVRDALVAFVKD